MLSPSKYRKTDLVVFSAMMQKDLHKRFMGLGHRAAMECAREMNKAIAEYKKVVAFDEVQMNAIKNIGIITNWCRDSFFTARMVTVKRNNPELSREGVKCRVRALWEKVVEAYRY